ncbi:hypothetical protein JZC40_004588, partial [Salmonella enterica subsp. enterica serovar Moero]|nr:hypothetical protein [Salmonella enterica subsp. enterica serovar Moero]
GGDSGSGGGDTGGGDSGSGGGTGGGSGSDGDGSGGGNTDGDGDLLAELKAFHRSFKDSLIINDSLPDFDNSDMPFDELIESNRNIIEQIDKYFNSSSTLIDSLYGSVKSSVPDMNLRIDDINNSFAAISGICRPLSFDIFLGLSETSSISKTFILSDFCIFYDNNIRWFIDWVFRIITAVAVYSIIVRGLQRAK